MCAKKRPGNEDWNYGCKKSRERRESKNFKKLGNGKSFCEKEILDGKISSVEIITTRL